MASRLPVLIRQNKVFDLVIQGRTSEQIRQQLGISEDTIARDMAAISDQVQQIAASRLDEVLAVALANYQTVIDLARREYENDLRREREWYAGKLDYESANTATKTLALEGMSDENGAPGKASQLAQLARATLPITDESQPIEVKRTVRTVRPPLQVSGRAQWLKLIVDTTVSSP